MTRSDIPYLAALAALIGGGLLYISILQDWPRWLGLVGLVGAPIVGAAYLRITEWWDERRDR